MIEADASLQCFNIDQKKRKRKKFQRHKEAKETSWAGDTKKKNEGLEMKKKEKKMIGPKI